MKVLVAGDYCPIERVGALINAGDYASVFSDVKSIVATTDYSIVNFECPVCNDNVKPIEKHGPNLRCSEKGVEALKWVGFKCVTLANNHFLDYGQQGVCETLEKLDTFGIDHVGGGVNFQEASKTLYKEIGGKTLAIINCCENEFSIATESSAGSNPLNPIQQYNSIVEARIKADFVIVVVHGGHENFQLPSPRMVETYRFFVDAGADAVVNHHQHCISGYEIWHGKPIFYGLGNFCFDDCNSRDVMWNEGYFVVFNFKSQDITFMLHPYIQCSKEPRLELSINGALDEKLRYLNETIANPVLLNSTIKHYYESNSKLYENIFEPIYNRLFLAAKARKCLPSFISKRRLLTAINYVQCEAHRDKLIWCLKRLLDIKD